MSERPPLRFFLDECVPDSVGRLARAAGHDVIVLREAGASGSPDQLVCTLAEANNAILVSLDGDMRQIAKKAGRTGGRFATLNLVKLSCETHRSGERFGAVISLIEHEWMHEPESRARRVFLDIAKGSLRIYR